MPGLRIFDSAHILIRQLSIPASCQKNIGDSGGGPPTRSCSSAYISAPVPQVGIKVRRGNTVIRGYAADSWRGRKFKFASHRSRVATIENGGNLLPFSGCQ